MMFTSKEIILAKFIFKRALCQFHCSSNKKQVISNFSVVRGNYVLDSSQFWFTVYFTKKKTYKKKSYRKMDFLLQLHQNKKRFQWKNTYHYDHIDHID